ncbi:TetR/AcrR family transcriptional regulator [Actinomadura logoneensis]|uniref:TetR/AcrR family transcriptional regulator n=1 Tax=Actinomadura logoneensis TaxID=2293572 RepID=A0A372JNG6_9ACTN|nr:TetR/AcrR family transcriptional regulator [Actinomadura logoneensis]RFU41562.1 TetR/AcrR family transcriptional regulator [Actinomadura logoneensis]
MARPRTFDEDRAVATAMRLFWENGYEATSTRDLCTALGLDRSSVYNAFTSKRELFRRALVRYTDMMTAGQLEILDDPDGGPALDRIRRVLDRVVRQEHENFQNGRGIGCLSVNTTAEVAGRDPEIAALLERDSERRLGSLRAAVEAGRRDGSITSTRDPDDLARYLNAVIAGIRISGQGGTPPGTLAAIAATALDTLTP